MNVRLAFAGWILSVALPLMICGQTPNDTGSISMSRCYECKDFTVNVPEIAYPRYVGRGAETFAGEVAVQITIDGNGRIESAKAISGHPFFRQLLENRLLNTLIVPDTVDRKVFPANAVLFYKIKPPSSALDVPGAVLDLGILNGRARSLPKPDYPKDLQKLCADGIVQIELMLDNNGDVVQAEPLSGDALLFPVSLDAAKRASFSRGRDEHLPAKGMVEYNFVPDKECVDLGNVTGKWVKAPEFSIQPDSVVEPDLQLLVRVAIDPRSGNVIAAKVLGAHPIIAVRLENQAMGIKFGPTLINRAPSSVKGFIRLKIAPNLTIEPFE